MCQTIVPDHHRALSVREVSGSDLNENGLLYSLIERGPAEMGRRNDGDTQGWHLAKMAVR